VAHERQARRCLDSDVLRHTENGTDLRPLVPRHRRGEVGLDIDVRVIGDVEHDLDDLTVGEREPDGYVELTGSALS
jgi:hypothetical protein